jgi:hypothetical protein
MIGDGSSERSGVQELAELLGLPVTADHDEIKRAFRIEVKRLHPDAGVRTTSDIERLERLIAARAMWNQESPLTVTEEGDPWDEDWSDLADQDGESSRGSQPKARRTLVEERVEPSPWFVQPPSGPQPRTGFWGDRPGPSGR